MAVLAACAVVPATAGQVEADTFGSALVVGVAGAVLLTVVISLALDVWGGMVAALVVAVALTAVRRHEGWWIESQLVPIVVETLGLLLCGAVAGYVGGLLRQRVGSSAPVGLAPVYGSMGLLGGEPLMARLEEELSRSRVNGRPVVVAVLEVRTVPSAPGSVRHAALRTVARVVENRAREHDVPFALNEERLGLLLLEGPTTHAWDVLGEVLAAIGKATFLVGEERAPRLVHETVSVHVGIARSRPHHETPDALLDEAVSAAVNSGQAPVDPAQDGHPGQGNQVQAP